MTEADIDTMREIVSEDKKFVHMSGMTQTREEYFADVADGIAAWVDFDVD